MNSAWKAAMLLICCAGLAQGQGFPKGDRDMVAGMLREASNDVQKNYYDPKLHGLDWDAKVRQTRENIDKARTTDDAVAEVAALLDSLNDSHTYINLPPRSYKHYYGFMLKMFGDHCYVDRVHAGSDAEKKGLKRGDEVLAINDHPVTRKTLSRLEYIFKQLRPQPGLRLTLRGENGEARTLDVMAKVTPSSVLMYSQAQGINRITKDSDDWLASLEPRYFERGDDLLVVELPEFLLSAEAVDHMVGKMRKHKGVVLDLRGNPGGATETEDRLLGSMFDHDRKVYDRVTRKETKPVTVQGRHHEAYTGRLVVLVDSESASASELFARVIQLEKRGFVVGDRSAGAVMEAEHFKHATSLGWLAAFTVSVTDADLLMTDGQSLEHIGVEPDFIVLPSAEDLAARRDPALAKAAGIVGVKLTPEEASAALPDRAQFEY